MRNGYVILRGAVEPDAIDAVRADIDKVVSSEHELSKVSYWKGGEKFFERANPQRILEEEAKLLDMHMLSDPVRKAFFSPRLLRFMQLVFERPPVAFQSLTFEYGSQQPVHCDVAFVHVSSPREFVASWIALEDIEPGSGELEYFPGSHCLDDYLFPGQTPWACGDLSDYNRQLVSKAGQAGLKLERFLPRKGDVLFWNAGLYHGGSKCDRSKTRRSLVTHYCPVDRLPMYAPDSGRFFDTPYGGYVSGCSPANLHTV